MGFLPRKEKSDDNDDDDDDNEEQDNDNNEDDDRTRATPVSSTIMSIDPRGCRKTEHWRRRRRRRRQEDVGDLCSIFRFLGDVFPSYECYYDDYYEGG